MSDAEALRQHGAEVGRWFASIAAQKLDGPAATALLAGSEPSWVLMQRRAKVIQIFETLIGALALELIENCGEDPAAVAGCADAARAAFTAQLNRAALAAPIAAVGNA